MLRLALLLLTLCCTSARAGSIMFSGAADLGNAFTTLSASYTVGSGNNRILVVCFVGNILDNITATYNGVAMTGPVAVDNNQGMELFYFLNPTSNTHTLTFTDNSGAGFIQLIAADYSNVKQTGQPDGVPSTVDDTSAGNDTFSGSYSTTANAATVIGCASNQGNGTAPSISGSFTRRTYAAQYGDTLLADTGPVAPHGSVTLTATIYAGRGPGFTQGQSFLSLLPVPGGGGFMLNGVGN